MKLQLCDKCIRLTSKEKYTHVHNNRKNIPEFFSPRMSREQKAVDRARKAFETGRSKPLEYRIHQLKNLQRLLTERKRDIADAIKKDLGKVSTALPPHPNVASNLFVCLLVKHAWIILYPDEHIRHLITGGHTSKIHK